MGAKKELFGEMAVRRGFVAKRDVDLALHRQKEIVVQGGKHKLIGLLMVEMGLLSTVQLITLLKDAQLDATLHPHPPRASNFGD